MFQGRYFEDFAVGDVYRHGLGRTITDTDNTWFTLLTMNTNELHFNDHVAAGGEFGRPLVNSGFSVALVLGLSVGDVSQHAVANLGWDDIRLVAPVFVGDTIYAESLVTDARPSASRPRAGVVTVRTQGLKSDGTVFMRFHRSVLVRRRSAAAEQRFPEASIPITCEIE